MRIIYTVELVGADGQSITYATHGDNAADDGNIYNELFLVGENLSETLNLPAVPAANARREKVRLRSTPKIKLAEAVTAGGFALVVWPRSPYLPAQINLNCTRAKP